jgi:hypothetical protein
MAYTLATHHHRFAAWAAARAAQRRLANSRTIINALHVCGVVQVVDTNDYWPTTAAMFDVVHREWCRALVNHLLSAGINAAKYGHAAKIIAVYLKSRIVLSGHHDTRFASVIHLPIDRILLRAVAGHMRATDRPLATRLRTTAWTALTETSYDELIACLRGAGFDRPAFWYIERFWNPCDDEGLRFGRACRSDQSAQRV